MRLGDTTSYTPKAYMRVLTQTQALDATERCRWAVRPFRGKVDANQHHRRRFPAKRAAALRILGRGCLAASSRPGATAARHVSLCRALRFSLSRRSSSISTRVACPPVRSSSPTRPVPSFWCDCTSARSARIAAPSRIIWSRASDFSALAKLVARRTEPRNERRVEKVAHLDAVLSGDGAHAARHRGRGQVGGELFIRHAPQRSVERRRALAEDLAEHGRNVVLAPASHVLEVQVAVAHAVEPDALGLQQFERVVHPLHVANVRPERHAEKWHVECLSLAHHELNIDLLMRDLAIGRVKGRQKKKRATVLAVLPRQRPRRKEGVLAARPE